MKYKFVIKNILVIFLLFSLIFSITGIELAELIDNRDNPIDIKSTISMEIKNKKGKVRTSSIKSISKNNAAKQILWFIEPADDKGVAYLKIEHDNKDDEMRLWLPAFKRIRRISSKKKSESFMGSDMSYEDMTSRKISDYKYTLLGEEKIDSINCYILETIPLKKSEYSKHITWVSTDSFLPFKEDSYDSNNRLLKNKLINYTKIDDYFIATKLNVKNVQKNHETTLWITNVIVDSNVKDDIFQEKNLKRIKYK